MALCWAIYSLTGVLLFQEGMLAGCLAEENVPKEL